MLNVLIVDDSPATSDITAEQVRALGHRARQVDDGATALELLAQERFDVVLTDLRMPGMDGLELVRRISSRYGPRRPRVVVLSGVERRDCQRSPSADLDDFLTRPVSLSQLRAALEGRSAPQQRLVQAGVIDTTHIDELVAVIGPGELRRAAGPFIAETPQLISRLASCAGHDAGQTLWLAHLIKGRALSLGAHQLAAQAALIEALARGAAVIEPGHLAALDQAFAGAVAALHTHLAGYTQASLEMTTGGPAGPPAY